MSLSSFIFLSWMQKNSGKSPRYSLPVNTERKTCRCPLHSLSSFSPVSARKSNANTELSFLIQNFSPFAFGSAPQFAHYPYTVGVVKHWSLPLLLGLWYSQALLHGCMWTMVAGHQIPAKASLSLPSPAGQGRGNIMKGSRVKVRTGRDQSPLTVLGKTNLT